MMQMNRAAIRRLEQRLNSFQDRHFNIDDMYETIPPVTDWCAAMASFDLDDWQVDYLKAAPKNDRVAIAASRQSGKSTIVALFCAYLLLMYPNFMILVASRSLRQASYFIDKVRAVLLAILPRSSFTQMNRLSMELGNKSLIVSVPTAQPDAGRGFSPMLMLIDEAAFAPDALFTAVIPSVAATHGAVHMISSPNGRQGRFFEAFEGTAKDVFWTRRVTWRDCPRMTEEQMAIERRALGEMAFKQEFESQFLSPMGAFFSPDSTTAFYENREDQIYDDLDLDGLEVMAQKQFGNPTPSVEEMSAAFDAAQRIAENRFYAD